MLDYLMDWYLDFLELFEGPKIRFYAPDSSGCLHFADRPEVAMLLARSSNLEMA